MACETFRRALAEGTPPDAAHRATCPRCAALVAPPPAVAAPVPDLAALRARHRHRVAGRAALLAAAAAVLAALLRPGPDLPPPDLVAALDDAQAATELAPDVLADDPLELDAVTDLDPLF